MRYAAVVGATMPASMRSRDEMDREIASCRLRELREDAGYTQNTLAAAIGVNQNRVSQIEHGDLSTSRVDTLRRYVEATGGELEVAVKRPDGSRVLLGLYESPR